MIGILQRRERKLSHTTKAYLVFSPFWTTVYSCTSTNSLQMVDLKSWISRQFCQSMESSLLSWARCVVKLRSYFPLPQLPLIKGQVGSDTVQSRITCWWICALAVLSLSITPAEGTPNEGQPLTFLTHDIQKLRSLVTECKRLKQIIGAFLL